MRDIANVYPLGPRTKIPPGVMCHYCGARAATRDHVVPRSRGGVDVEWNIVPACYPCNSDKASYAPTCSCVFCRNAVMRYEDGERATTSRHLNARVKFRDGVWKVMVPRVPSESKRAIFRTLSGAYRFALAELANSAYHRQ